MAEVAQLTVQGGTATDTIYPLAAAGGLQSDSEDNICWERHFGASVGAEGMDRDRDRIEVERIETSVPLRMTLALSSSFSTSAPLISTLFLVGRSRHGAPSHLKEYNSYLLTHVEAIKRSVARSTEVRRSLGEVGTGMVVNGDGAGVWIVQSWRGMNGGRGAQV